jgi:hypothetical protein
MLHGLVRKHGSTGQKPATQLCYYLCWQDPRACMIGLIASGMVADIARVLDVMTYLGLCFCLLAGLALFSLLLLPPPAHLLLLLIPAGTGACRAFGVVKGCKSIFSTPTFSPHPELLSRALGVESHSRAAQTRATTSPHKHTEPKTGTLTQKSPWRQAAAAVAAVCMTSAGSC